MKPATVKMMELYKVIQTEYKLVKLHYVITILNNINIIHIIHKRN